MLKLQRHNSHLLIEEPALPVKHMGDSATLTCWHRNPHYQSTTLATPRRRRADIRTRITGQSHGRLHDADVLTGKPALPVNHMGDSATLTCWQRNPHYQSITWATPRRWRADRGTRITSQSHGRLRDADVLTEEPALPVNHMGDSATLTCWQRNPHYQSITWATPRRWRADRGTRITSQSHGWLRDAAWFLNPLTAGPVYIRVFIFISTLNTTF